MLPSCANAQAPFAKGTDVSWVTQMEQAGRVFYNEAGTQQMLLDLMAKTRAVPSAKGLGVLY